MVAGSSQQQMQYGYSQQQQRQQIAERQHQIEEAQKKVQSSSPQFSQQQLRGATPIQRQMASQQFEKRKAEVLSQLGKETQSTKQIEAQFQEYLQTPEGRLQWAVENLSPEEIQKGKNIMHSYSLRGVKGSYQTGDEVQTPYGPVIVPLSEHEIKKQAGIAQQNVTSELYKESLEKLLPKGETLVREGRDWKINSTAFGATLSIPEYSTVANAITRQTLQKYYDTNIPEKDLQTWANKYNADIKSITEVEKAAFESNRPPNAVVPYKEFTPAELEFGKQVREGTLPVQVFGPGTTDFTKSILGAKIGGKVGEVLSSLKVPLKTKQFSETFLEKPVTWATTSAAGIAGSATERVFEEMEMRGLYKGGVGIGPTQEEYAKSLGKYQEPSIYKMPLPGGKIGTMTTGGIPLDIIYTQPKTPTASELGAMAGAAASFGIGAAFYSNPVTGTFFTASQIPGYAKTIGYKGYETKILTAEQKKKLSPEALKQVEKDLGVYNKQVGEVNKALQKQKILAGVGLGLSTLYLGGVAYQQLTKPIPISKIQKYETFKQGKAPAVGYKVRFYEPTIPTKYGARQYLLARQEFPSVYQKYTTPFRKIVGLEPKIKLLQKGVTYKFLGQYDVGASEFTGGYRVSKLLPYAKVEKIYQVRGQVGGAKFQPYILKKTPYLKGGKVTEPVEFESIFKLKKLGKDTVLIPRPTEKLITRVYGIGKVKPLEIRGYIPKTGIKITQAVPGRFEVVAGLKQVKGIATEPIRAGKIGTARGTVQILSPGETAIFKIATPGKLSSLQKLSLLRMKGGRLFPQLEIPRTQLPPRIQKIEITAPRISELQRLALERQAERLLPRLKPQFVVPELLKRTPLLPVQFISRTSPQFLTASRVNLGLIGVLAPKVVLNEEPILKFVPRTETAIKIFPVEQTKVAPTEQAKSESFEKSLFSLGQAQFPIQVPKITQAEIPKYAIQNVQSQVKPPYFPPIEPIKIPMPFRRVPPTEDFIRRKKRKQVLFVPFVRRKGKFMPVTAPTTKERAVQFGVSRLRETLGASLQIRTIKGEKVKFGKTTPEFRFGGRAEKDVFTLIQRAPKRLASYGERAEIVRSRKAGRIKFI